MEFGPLLKAMRGGRSLADVSHAVYDLGFKVSTQKLSAWERGEYRPKDPPEVRALERALNCPGELVRALGWDDDSRLAVLERRLDAIEQALRSGSLEPLDGRGEP